MAVRLPQHLRKYVVEQHYEKYTALDHSVWRFILRQLRDFLSQNAHECYLEGLLKTGIDIERIPRIEDISKKLEEFGWRALPVSGFIPPAAFMELQSLSVLPIASDMRTLEHLEYTPAPDIIHEAAGHAPILVNQAFADYLREYASVAKKAIISKEDLDVYQAIRDLSDIKENPDSTVEDIKAAEERLNIVSKNITHISEASELSRMNWWTAEYGLIGSLENPKIYGAGLLSSLGESHWCLSKDVKKIPLTKDCIKVGYDITEPQPQLFVASSFADLSRVLHDLAVTMAFHMGGVAGLEKARKAKSINTVQLNSGIEISGVLSEFILDDEGKVAYLLFNGPCQLAHEGKEIAGHSREYHAKGYGTAVGHLVAKPDACPSELSSFDWKSFGVIEGQEVELKYTSGVQIKGRLKSTTARGNHLVLMSFENCTVTMGTHVLFRPEWGVYDLAVGCQVPSVYGGPADRDSYGELTDFVAQRVPQPQYSNDDLQIFGLYERVRGMRENRKIDLGELRSVLSLALTRFNEQWLLGIELYELCVNFKPAEPLKDDVSRWLLELQQRIPEKKHLIQEGMRLANVLQ